MLESKDEGEADRRSIIIEGEIDTEVDHVDELEHLLVKENVTIVGNLVIGLEIVQMETGEIDASGVGKLDIYKGNAWVRIFQVIQPLEATRIVGILDQEVVVEEMTVIVLEVRNVGDHLVIAHEVRIVHGLENVPGRANRLKRKKTENLGAAHGPRSVLDRTNPSVLAAGEKKCLNP